MTTSSFVPNAARRLGRLLAVVALMLIAGACSGDADAGEVPVASQPASEPNVLASQQGAIYVQTIDGDLVTIDPARQAAGVLWDSSAAGQNPIIDIAPTPNQGLFLSVNQTEAGVSGALHTVAGGQIEQVANNPLGMLVICFDNHMAATISVANQVVLGDEGFGLELAPIEFDHTGVLLNEPQVLARRNVGCPRWSADRTVRFTSSPIADGFETVAVHIDGPGKAITITEPQCSLDVTSVAPDDATALVNATCFGQRSQTSGLYRLTLDQASNDTTLDDMEKLGSGIYGRTGFNADGTAIVAVRRMLVTDLAVDADLTQVPVDVVTIDLATGQEHDFRLPNDTQPSAVVWLPSPVH